MWVKVQEADVLRRGLSSELKELRSSPGMVLTLRHGAPAMALVSARRRRTQTGGKLVYEGPSRNQIRSETQMLPRMVMNLTDFRVYYSNVLAGYQRGRLSVVFIVGRGERVIAATLPFADAHRWACDKHREALDQGWREAKPTTPPKATSSKWLSSLKPAAG